MSNANPLLAKLALDNEAKTTATMRANWSYEDVETKVWNIPKMTDFWGIGSRTEKRLNKLGIYSIKEFTNCDPTILKKNLVLLEYNIGFMLMASMKVMSMNLIALKQSGLGIRKCSIKITLVKVI